MQLNILDTFNKELPGDPNRHNTRRQVFDACFSYVRPRIPKKPQLIHVSDEMLYELGMSEEDKNSEEFLKIFSGAEVLKDTQPYAMCYGGHQFGTWAGQLGDGRAINLAEVVHEGQRWALQLKGAGETPYSRSADGLAVLRSSLREHLCSEAMYHLGVPTTRALSVILTGDKVLRDILYDGNPAYERGAVVCRAAPSFIRFGNFQILAARRDVENVKKLADYTIRHFFPHINSGGKEAYVRFFREVTERTLEMVLHWQRVGFVHGVMNTDNMSILGLTIDYGPYGWLEGYDPDWTPNTTDAHGRRYRFGNQPGIALWNLAQLGNVLVPLIGETQPLEEILEGYNKQYANGYLEMMCKKTGLQVVREGDHRLVEDLIKGLRMTETDMTIFFRRLSRFECRGKLDGEGHFLQPFMDAFYQPGELGEGVIHFWQEWFARYQNRLKDQSMTDEERGILMNRVNPKYVLRNYMVQMAIDKADEGEYSLVEELYQVMKKPYDEQSEYERWSVKRPEWARNKVGCSMLSCSS